MGHPINSAHHFSYLNINITSNHLYMICFIGIFASKSIFFFGSNLIWTENSKFFLQPHHSYTCYKSIKGYISGLVNRTVQRGQNGLGNRKLLCTYIYHSYACYTSIKGCTSELENRTLQRGQNGLGNRKLLCTYAPALQTTTSPPLPSTIQGHYLMPQQIFPSFGDVSILGQNMLQIFQRK